MKRCRHLWLLGGQLSAEQFAEFHTPFALDAATAQAPTEIELTLLLGGVRHQYGLAFDRHRIVGEWLYVHETSRPQRWFMRRHDAASGQEVWEPFSTHLKGPRDTWRRATAPRATFLATAAQLNSEQLQPLKAWFESGLHIVVAGGAPDVAPTLLRLNDPALAAKPRSAGGRLRDDHPRQRQMAQARHKIDRAKARLWCSAPAPHGDPSRGPSLTRDVMGPDDPSETFRVLKDKELRQHGEYRTRRLVLDARDRLEAGKLRRPRAIEVSGE